MLREQSLVLCIWLVSVSAPLESVICCGVIYKKAALCGCAVCVYGSIEHIHLSLEDRIDLTTTHWQEIHSTWFSGQSDFYTSFFFFSVWLFSAFIFSSSLGSLVLLFPSSLLVLPPVVCTVLSGFPVRWLNYNREQLPLLLLLTVQIWAKG